MNNWMKSRVFIYTILFICMLTLHVHAEDAAETEQTEKGYDLPILTV